MFIGTCRHDGHSSGLKLAAIGFVGFAAVHNLLVALLSLWPPHVYRKDFIQEYLLAKAVLERLDPYAPLPDLAERLLGPLPHLILPTPSPHPPPVAVLGLPLGFLSYGQSAVVWFVLELGCILVSAYLLLRCVVPQPRSLAHILFVGMLMLGWSPFLEELVQGQLMILQLALLLVSWRMFHQEKSMWGGALVGVVLAVKLIAWPLVLLLAIWRKWCAVGAAIAVFILANIAAAMLMGLATVIGYYLKAPIMVWPLYRGHIANCSLWGIAWRIFGGTGSPVLAGISSPPLIDAPELASHLAPLLCLLLLAISCYLVATCEAFDTAYGVMVCVTILVAPLAWSHFFVLASIPLAITLRRLRILNCPRMESLVFISLALLLVIPRSYFQALMLFLTGQDAISSVGVSVPFTVSVISLGPTAALTGLLWLVSRLDQGRYAKT